MLKAVIADDERKVRSVLFKKGNWDALGIQIVGEAEDGDSLCALLEEHRPHIVLTDMRMPGLCGAELIRFIRSRYEDIQILIVSGYQDFEYLRQAISAQAVDYILKPVEAQELNKSLQRAVEQIHSSAEKAREAQENNRNAYLVEESILNRFFDGLNVSDVELIPLLGPESGTSTLRAGVLRFFGMETVCAEHFGGDSLLLRYGLLNMLSELLQPCAKAFCRTGSKDIAVILWGDTSEKRCSMLADDIRKKLETHLRISAALGLSEEGTCLASLPGLYAHAEETLPYLSRELDGGIWFYGANSLPSRVHEYIERYYSSGLTAEAVASHFFVSQQHLSKLFKDRFGLSPYEYITYLRVERAKEMLLAGCYKSREIVMELGFSDESHFSRTFKKHTGLSPRAYQERTKP